MIAQSLEKLSLAGKVAVVTGGTQGLGEAIAHMLAERGAEGLVICGRNEANGQRVKAALEQGRQDGLSWRPISPGRGLPRRHRRRRRIPSGRSTSWSMPPEYRPRHDLGHEPRALQASSWPSICARPSS